MKKALNLLALIFCAFIANLSLSADLTTLGWLGFGDLRGNIEPCGCDPKTDMGGIRRIAATLKRERALNPDLLLFDLGNNFPFADGKNLGEIDKLKFPFLQEGLAALKPTARLYNFSEMENSINAPNFVLTNSNSKKAKREISGKNYIVYGINALEKDKSYKAFLKKSFQNNRNKMKFLLYSGDDAFLSQLLKDFTFDVVISSNRAAWPVQPGKDEKENPKTLERTIDGKIIYMTPLGGQGFVRGGKLLAQSAPSLEQIFNKTSPTQPLSLSQSNPFTWLTKDLDDENELASLFSRYRQAQNNQFESSAKLRLADLKNSAFAGAEACKSCHESAYNTWKSSKHSHAFLSLKQKQSDTSSECVSCHTVGFKEKGGFVDEKHSSWLAGVQCENCHGPRKDHTLNPTIHSKINAKEVCTSCHHNPHSSSFIFSDYWEKIQHGK